MAATTSRINGLGEARPAAMASIPASPSATVWRAPSGSADVAATSTRPGSRTSSSHSPGGNENAMFDLRTGWYGMATSRRQHMPGSRMIRLRSALLDGLRKARLLGSRERALGHHHPAPEDADQGAVLLVAPGLDAHDTPVGLGLGLPLVEHGRLAVDRVAVEGRRDVAQGLHFQVGDRLARNVGHRHAEQDRVDV